MSLTHLLRRRGGRAHAPGAPIPTSQCSKSLALECVLQVLVFSLYTVRNGRKYPYYSDELCRVVAYTGGKPELQAKIVAEFSGVVNKVSTDYERNM